MDYDTDRLDETVLALLHLNAWEEGEWGARAWKDMPWEATDRLHEKDLIDDPKSKARSVVLTPEAVASFSRAFARRAPSGDPPLITPLASTDRPVRQPPRGPKDRVV